MPCQRRLGQPWSGQKTPRSLRICHRFRGAPCRSPCPRRPSNARLRLSRLRRRPSARLLPSRHPRLVPPNKSTAPPGQNQRPPTSRAWQPLRLLQRRESQLDQTRRQRWSEPRRRRPESPGSRPATHHAPGYRRLMWRHAIRRPRLRFRFVRPRSRLVRQRSRIVRPRFRFPPSPPPGRHPANRRLPLRIRFSQRFNPRSGNAK